MTEQNNAPPMPWAGWPDEIGCNFAAGHLVRNLGAPLTLEGGLHAETLMCTAGAVAGWAAHRTLIAGGAGKPVSLQMVTMKDGRQMLYGDGINDMLVSNDPAFAPRCVWNNLAGTAMAYGLAESDLPQLDDLFRSVTERLGTPLEGFPSVGQDHQPQTTAAGLLDLVLPVTLRCLTGEISETTKTQGFHAAETSYQIVTSWVAANLLGQCTSVLKPRTALIICMEAAIYASKLTAPFQPQV